MAVEPIPAGYAETDGDQFPRPFPKLLPLEAPGAVPAQRVTFIVPVHNEERTIGQVLDLVSGLELDKQVIVVDDGSTDGTSSVLSAWERNNEVTVLSQPNRGKGAAIRAAIPYVEGDIVVIQDADMEYDPADVPLLVDPIMRGVADVVFGSRLTGGRPQRAHMFWHKVGNQFLSLLTSILFNTTLSDMETGYKVFRRSVLDKIHIRSDRFNFEPEITAKVAKTRCRVYEVPISYSGRTYDEGKKIGARDGLAALWAIIKFRFVD